MEINGDLGATARVAPTSGGMAPVTFPLARICNPCLVYGIAGNTPVAVDPVDSANLARAGFFMFCRECIWFRGKNRYLCSRKLEKSKKWKK